MSVKLRQRSTKDGRKSLYLDIYDKGKRSYKYLDMFLTNDKVKNKELLRIAEAIRDQYASDMVYKKTGIVNPKLSDSDFLQYLMKISQRNLSKKTVENYWSAHNHLLAFNGGKSFKFNQIDSQTINNFQNYLINKGLSNNTIRGNLKIINAVFNAAIKEKIISENPVKNVKFLKAQESKREFLTKEELTKLSKTHCKNDNIKNAFIFSCLTGLRLGDISSLQFENIKNEHLEIRQSKTKELLRLPMNITSLNIINKQKLISNQKHIFTFPNKEKFSKILKEWLRDAEINKKITFHCARHTHALLLLESGVAVYTVSKLLGHTSIRTTEIYAHILDETKQKAVDKLPVLNI